MITPPADLRNREFARILLIKLSAVGDVIHTIPVLNKLRRRYSAAQLDWLVTPAIGELLRHHPAISNVIEFARDDWSAPWRPVRLAAKLRRTRYDLVVDMHGQFRTAVFALATGAPVRIGFDRPRASVWDASPRKFPEETRKHAWQGAREGSWIAYTHHIPVPTLDLHAVDRYLNVGPLLGLDSGAADFSFPIPAEANNRIEALLDYYGAGGKRLAVLAPGTIWETKQWRRAGFAEVARYLLQKGFAVVLAGAGRERAVCAEVAKLEPGVCNLAGETTLSELAALVRRAAHLRDQRFRPDASCRRARTSGRQHIWADRSDLDWSLSPRGCGVASKSRLLTVLSAATEPLRAWACLHAKYHRVGSDRTHRSRYARTAEKCRTRARPRDISRGRAVAGRSAAAANPARFRNAWRSDRTSPRNTRKQ